LPSFALFVGDVITGKAYISILPEVTQL